ncbi:MULTISPECIES: hypothetical protein [Bradyrhizobium]|uniref:hypothetical protein n=1 Tax=Bradyrhizobium TaxID=374 RepID=UPI00167D1F39|nr:MULTISPECIES: hypothetical protein [Bradyrhizobium]WOH52866.1 hypothetical protein RX328_12690 [Bradyrhizobium sp. sBnM-33]
MVKTFADVARERLRLRDGGYRRDHLRALAQRIEVAEKEVRIMGSKSELLRPWSPPQAKNRRLSAFAVLY